MNKNMKSKLALASAGAILGVSLFSGTIGFATSKSNNIGIEKAKEIALKDAGLKSGSVSFIKAKLDTDDGVQVYDIEFYSGNIEYDYEINAKTGAITEKDFDIENYSIPKNTNKNQNKAQTPKGLISVEKAKEIALKDSGLKASNVSFIKAKLDIDDGVQVYDIEFYSGNKEYDYEINAKTGAIREKDFDIENYSIQKNTNKNQNKAQTPKGLISVEKAKDTALKDSGLKSGSVSFIKAKLDTDDGVQVYDIEFYSGNKEYDYEINAKTGAIREKDFDIENYSIPKNTNKNQNKTQTPKGLISVEKAKEIALKDAGLKSGSVSFIKAKLDTDDGVQVYDIEFKVGTTEYNYEIEAKTGNIVESDVDHDD